MADFICLLAHRACLPYGGAGKLWIERTGSGRSRQTACGDGATAALGNNRLLLHLLTFHRNVQCLIDRFHQHLEFERFGQIAEEPGFEASLDFTLKGV